MPAAPEYDGGDGGTSVLPPQIASIWGHVALMFAFWGLLNAPYAAVLREPCDGSWRFCLNLAGESFFAIDLCILYLNARKQAAQKLGSSRLASRVALRTLLRTSTFYWRLIPCLPLLLYPMLDCTSATWVQLLWLLRLRRGRQHMMRLKNNVRPYPSRGAAPLALTAQRLPRRLLSTGTSPI